MKKRMRNYEGIGIASELIIDQMKRTRFWLCAFVIAVTAFVLFAVLEAMQK